MTPDHTLAIDNLVAHRGFAARYLENTHTAVAAAIACGARFVEIDIQLSHDRIPVLYHDRTLEKLARLPGTIGDLSYRQLTRTALTIDSDGTRPATRDRIWGLAELVPLIQAHREVTVFVELKRVSMLQFGMPEIVDRVLELLAPIREQCVIISFASDALRYARSRGATRIGWVMEPWDDAMLGMAHALAPDFLFTDHAIIPASAIPLPAAPWQWALYEIGSLELARTWHARGAQLLETFRIGELIAALKG